MPFRYRVIVVMDPSYGERLVELAQHAHVWAIQSPENEEAQRSFLASKPPGWNWSERVDSGLTIIRSKSLDLDVLESIILHHGEYSHDPPVDALEVIGCALDEHVGAAFVEQGFPILVARPEGFLALRSPL